eukprot:s861_g1.t1
MASLHQEALTSSSRANLHECFELLAETVQVLSNSSDQSQQRADELAKEYASRINSVTLMFWTQRRQTVPRYCRLMRAIDSLLDEDIKLRSDAAEQAQACLDLRFRVRCGEERLRLSKRLRDEFADFNEFAEAERVDSGGKKATADASSNWSAQSPGNFWRASSRQSILCPQEVFIEPVTRGNRARAGGMPEEASGYLNGVVHGGSSSSTASATQGSRLSKSGSAPSLVEA